MEETCMPFYIGLVKKFVCIFHNILWKNLNKLLGQPDVTTGYFYHALQTLVSQNIQIQITGSNMSSFLDRQEMVADVGQNKMARGAGKMSGFLWLSSAVTEYDTTVSCFCSRYIHITSLLQLCSLSIFSLGPKKQPPSGES